MNPQKHTVLIVGSSGFIGNAIYKDICSYFETHGTYFSQKERFKENNVFHYYSTEKGGLSELLKTVNPSIIISCHKGEHRYAFSEHKVICEYIKAHHYSRLLYISSGNVFDGLFEFPSYENHSPKSSTAEGVFKIKMERLLFTEISAQLAILRLPLVLGNTSPIIAHLRKTAEFAANFDVYPNKIISVTTINKVAQQIHYIINKNLDGIFHLASEDVIHHNDLMMEICNRFNGKFPIFKNVYSRNEDYYNAILPKVNMLPETYRITVAQVVENCILENISTTRNTNPY
jgi:dTDP-4-dehydrorhamnose reductase